MITTSETVYGVSSGDIIDHLTLIGVPFRVSRGVGKKRRRYWIGVFRCDCGTVKALRIVNVKFGKTKACGCRMRRVTHGRTTSREVYGTWRTMVRRCTNVNAPDYSYYGGRGITVCDDWRSFELFVEWAKSHGYSEDLQLDRIDNSKGYSPENCRFVTRSQNQRNSRYNKIIAAFGETKCLADWADDPRCKVSYDTLGGRLRHGWEPEKAITFPCRSRRVKAPNTRLASQLLAGSDR